MTSSWLTILGAVGTACSLLALGGLALALANEGKISQAFACLGGMTVILLLLFVGLELHDDFWRNGS